MSKTIDKLNLDLSLVTDCIEEINNPKSLREIAREVAFPFIVMKVVKGDDIVTQVGNVYTVEGIEKKWCEILNEYIYVASNLIYDDEEEDVYRCQRADFKAFILSHKQERFK